MLSVEKELILAKCRDPCPILSAVPNDADVQFAPPPQAGDTEREPYSAKVGDELDD